MSRWKNNIILILIIRVSYSLIFCIPVITLYWGKYGLDLVDMFLLQAIFAISIVILEVPTGYIGDWLGRKRTLQASTLVAVAGWYFYSQAGSFGEFVIAEIVLGIAFSFLSGTDTAILYESLKELNRTDDYTRISGRQNGALFMGEALSSIVGGLLSTVIHIEMLLIFTSMAALFGFIASLFLTEPHREPYRHPRGTLYGLYKIGRYVFLRSRIVRFVVPLMAVCSLSTMLGVWLYQPLWQERGIPLWLFGFLWAGLSVPAAVASHFAHVLEKWIGKRGIIICLPLPIAAGYLLAAFFPWAWAVGFVYLTTLVRGLTMPILSKYIHDETFSDKRATVLSIQNWLFRLGYFTTGPLVGWVGKSCSLSWGLIVSAVISIFLMVLFIIPVVKRIPE